VLCYRRNKKIIESIDKNQCKHNCDYAPGFILFKPEVRCSARNEISSTNSLTECASQVRQADPSKCPDGRFEHSVSQNSCSCCTTGSTASVSDTDYSTYRTTQKSGIDVYCSFEYDKDS